MRDDEIAAVLRDRADTLRQRLLAAVDANLSGGVLRTRTGALKASIVSELTAGVAVIEVIVESRGVPYAAIQEDGGATPAHDIVPVKARALAFAGGIFAKAHHPGSVIPARAPLRSALDGLHDEIAGGLKEAVRGALGAL